MLLQQHSHFFLHSSAVISGLVRIFHFCRADYFWKVPTLSPQIAQSHYGMGNVSYIFTLRKASTKVHHFPHPFFQLCLKFHPEDLPQCLIDLEGPCLHRTLINCRQSVERRLKASEQTSSLERLSVVPGPAVLAPPGNLLKQGIMGLTSDPLNLGLRLDRGSEGT